MNEANPQETLGAVSAKKAVADFLEELGASGNDISHIKTKEGGIYVAAVGGKPIACGYEAKP